jgi:hypothetical protein
MKIDFGRRCTNMNNPVYNLTLQSNIPSVAEKVVYIEKALYEHPNVSSVIQTLTNENTSATSS